MSIADKVGNINDAIQAFAQKGLETAETFHQMTAELPVDLARNIGLEDSKADLIKGTHRRMVTRFYGAVGDVGKQMGQLLVTQAADAEKLVQSLASADAGQPAAYGKPEAKSPKEAGTKKAGAEKKASKKTRKKSVRKKIARKPQSATGKPSDPAK